MHRNRTPSDTRIYRIWINMRQRCNNPHNDAYQRYGGRGITICKEWDDFTAFEEWAYSHGYREYLTIDRINNDGNYEPSNCRWATMAEQVNNRGAYNLKATWRTKPSDRPKPQYEIDGISHSSAEWAEIAGITQKLFLKRWGNGKRGQELIKPSKTKKEQPETLEK